MTKITFLKSEIEGQEYTEEGLARLAFTIKASMRLRGWSERELAKQAGVSHVTINKYLKAAIYNPQTETLKSLAPFINRVAAITEDNIEIDSELTYGDAWQDLDRLASSQFTPELLSLESD